MIKTNAYIIRSPHIQAQATHTRGALQTKMPTPYPSHDTPGTLGWEHHLS